MNRRRELVLQRVSRIGSLTAAESVSQNTKWKGRPTGMLTIEAAIGAYMKKDTDVYNLHRQQDAYIPVSKDPGQQEKEQLSRQMKEYQSELEESQLANVKSELEKKYSPQQLNAQKIKKVLENEPSAQYQLRMYGKNEYIDGHSAFDRLDENRCSGFLLYSYNKKGVHSVLGEHITPGSTRQKENKRGKLWIQST